MGQPGVNDVRQHMVVTWTGYVCPGMESVKSTQLAQRSEAVFCLINSFARLLAWRTMAASLFILLQCTHTKGTGLARHRIRCEVPNDRQILGLIDDDADKFTSQASSCNEQ